MGQAAGLGVLQTHRWTVGSNAFAACLQGTSCRSTTAINDFRVRVMRPGVDLDSEYDMFCGRQEHERGRCEEGLLRAHRNTTDRIEHGPGLGRMIRSDSQVFYDPAPVLGCSCILVYPTTASRAGEARDERREQAMRGAVRSGPDGHVCVWSR